MVNTKLENVLVVINTNILFRNILLQMNNRIGYPPVL
jgi:hypothetical protein